MDHLLAPSDALVRPWRTAALVATAVALVELLFLVAIGGGMLVRTAADHLQLAARKSVVATPKPAGPGNGAPAQRRLASATPAAKLPRSRTVVLVLNGNGETGAAAAAASRVSKRGYRIGGVANAPRSDFTRSLVMFKPGFAGEAHRLGRDLGVKLVGPLDGMRPRDLGTSQVVFILGD